MYSIVLCGKSQTAIMKTVIIEDKQRIESIILHCDACFVGITDLEGNPYVVPMNFGYENGIIYLHSGPEGTKLEMLEHNNNVCITFSVGHKYQHEKGSLSYSMRSESAMCRGKVIHRRDRRETPCIGCYLYVITDDVSSNSVRNVKV